MSKEVKEFEEFIRYAKDEAAKIRASMVARDEKRENPLLAILDELIADCERDIASKKLEESAEVDNFDDIPQSRKEELAEKIEFLALQSFKVLDKKTLEEAVKEPSLLITDNRDFAYFRFSIMKRALDFYKAIEGLPDLESFLKAGGCL